MTTDEKLDLLIDKIDTLEGRFDTLEGRFDTLEGRFDTFEDRLIHVENDVTDLKLTVENEIRVNIQRVAEGHIDIMRKFNQALKPSTEMEVLTIKVNRLESEMREVKRKIS